MAECTSSSSSWSNVSGANQRYRDLDTAAMHFWIDKRGVGAVGAPMGPMGGGPCGPMPRPLPLSHHGHYGRYGHRVSASIASSRLPPGAAPQRRRRPSRSSRTGGHPGANAAKATAAPAVHRDRGSGTPGTGAGPGGGGVNASTSGSATSTTTALTAATLAASSSAGAAAGAVSSRRVAAPVLAPAPLLARAARAHLALQRPRPRLAYIGSTGSGIRAHGAGGMLMDMEGMGGHGPSLGTSSGTSDRADVFGLGALPLPVHGESPPVLMDRFTCGLWASFALASVFVAGTKFYLDFQSSGMEAMVLSLLLMIFLMVGCTASICRARVNSQLAAAAAAATASALRGDTGPGGHGSGLRRSHLSDSGELVEVVIDRHGHGGMESVPGLAAGQQTQSQQQQLLQQVQQEQLAEQQLSAEPPPPYHIAMLDEQPPPAYEKVVT